MFAEYIPRAAPRKVTEFIKPPPSRRRRVSPVIGIGHKRCAVLKAFFLFSYTFWHAKLSAPEAVVVRQQ